MHVYVYVYVYVCVYIYNYIYIYTLNYHRMRISQTWIQIVLHQYRCVPRCTNSLPNTSLGCWIQPGEYIHIHVYT